MKAEKKDKLCCANCLALNRRISQVGGFDDSIVRYSCALRKWTQWIQNEKQLDVIGCSDFEDKALQQTFEGM